MCDCLQEFRLDQVPLFLLPGGREPVRHSEGAVGYDVAARVIVCPYEFDPIYPYLRKTLWDFHEQIDEKVQGNIAVHNGVQRYVLEPGKRVLIGIGFVTELPFPWFFWVAPRSGLATKDHICVTNAPGTIDPDYRGEAGVCLHNLGSEPFYIEKDMRIAQIIFQRATIPQFRLVPEYESLNKTVRGAGGFGWTGVR